MGVTAIYELPVPIWVSTEVLGQRVATGFGPLTFDVFMPNQGQPVGTPPVVDGITVPESSEEDSSRLLIWAQRFAAETPGPEHASTALCRVVVQTHSEPPRFNEEGVLAKIIDSWFDAVRTWVESATGQDLDPHHRIYDATEHGAGLTFLDSKGITTGPTAVSLTQRRINPVTATIWRSILAAVAAGEEAPVEEQLSRDARAALARGHLRRAISDAATAAEIVLHSLVKAHVSADDLSNADMRKKLRKVDNQPFGGLLTLVQDAGTDLGMDLKDLETLSTSRNHAVHRGTPPSYQVAAETIQAVVVLLDKHGPWARLRTAKSPEPS